jgi:hypothetical protein
MCKRVLGRIMDGNSTHGRGYPRIPDPTGKDMGSSSHPRARVRAQNLARGHTTGTKPHPRVLPVTRVQSK